MSLPLVMILLVLGILLAQALSDPLAVTLRWLRLGDLIALSLLALAGAALALDAPPGAGGALALGLILAGISAVAHLMLVQTAHRRAQRRVAGAAAAAVATLLIVPWCAASLAPYRVLVLDAAGDSPAVAFPACEPLIGACLVLAGWLTGGSLMTMLLGHAYLTAGSEMTQRPFLRLVRLLFAGLAVRLLIAGAAGLWGWLEGRSERGPAVMEAVLIGARFLMGLIVPLVMTWMAMQCVRLRSNQSATGILYVSSTMILVGEFIALSLITAHRLPF